MFDRWNPVGLLVLRLLAGGWLILEGAWNIAYERELVKDMLLFYRFPAVEEVSFFLCALAIIGGLFILIGFWMRSICLLVAVALFMGLFARPELDLIILKAYLFNLAVLLCLILQGPGRYAVDGALHEREVSKLGGG